MEEDLQNFISSLLTPFVVMGPFNAPNPLWGSTRINHTGKIVEKYLCKMIQPHSMMDRGVSPGRM